MQRRNGVNGFQTGIHVGQNRDNWSIRKKVHTSVLLPVGCKGQVKARSIGKGRKLVHQSWGGEKGFAGSIKKGGGGFVNQKKNALQTARAEN